VQSWRAIPDGNAFVHRNHLALNMMHSIGR
jgi:hypothetical protein